MFNKLKMDIFLYSVIVGLFVFGTLLILKSDNIGYGLYIMAFGLAIRSYVTRYKK